MTPLFSVLIPLYNKERHIQRSLGSVLAQSFDDFEVVVVDDGSTDGSAAVVAAYTDPRIRLIRQANAGVSAARNRGIQEARGKWIAFLDADDAYLPAFLERTVQAIQTFPDAGAAFCRLAVSLSGMAVAQPNTTPIPPIRVTDYFAFLLDTKNGGYGFSSSSAVIRADIFSTAGLFPIGTNNGEDVDMWYRVAMTTPITAIPDALAIYFVEDGASNWNAKPDVAVWFDTFSQWLRAGRCPVALEPSARRFYARECIFCALDLVRLHERRKAHAIMWRGQPLRYATTRWTALALLIVYACPVWLLKGLLACRKSIRRMRTRKMGGGRP